MGPFAVAGTLDRSLHGPQIGHVNKNENTRRIDTLRRLRTGGGGRINPSTAPIHSIFLPPGIKILVKPNLLAPTPPDFLPCTHPAVVRAVCLYFLEKGAEIDVGDSPTFGQGVKIAEKIGLTEALADLPVRLINLDRPQWVRLHSGGRALISRRVFEYEMFVNISKFKAHHQTRVTGAVKNVYGCVSGLYKPLFHFLYGDRGGRFRRMIYDLWRFIPPNISVMDAIITMHVNGPTNGRPYPLGLLGASPSPVALDTAVLKVIGLPPAHAPLWQTAFDLNLPGVDAGDIVYPLEPPASFNGSGFKTPGRLHPVSFRPLRIASHWLHRFFDREARAGGRGSNR